MYVLHGTAQITVGKAHNRAQNEFKYPCTGECKEQRHMYVHVTLYIYIYICIHKYVHMFMFMYVLHGTAQVPVGKAQTISKSISK